MKPPAISEIIGWFSISNTSVFAETTFREYEKTYPTYPFYDANPVPNFTFFYPYFRFEGFSDKPVDQKWKVVELSNDYLTLEILPEIGGKIWSVIEKKSGKSIVYANPVVKFRDIAMRGPWTSGGLETNVGIIGHTPNCSSPVDYIVQKNDDGSVSCFIGTLDLITRSNWTVEINLPERSAVFSTTVRWHNGSMQPQPYYTWMNVGIRAQDDLKAVNPGTKFIGHDGEFADWPIDSSGRDLSMYKNNNFGTYKSYHIFGKLADYFGAYYQDEDFGIASRIPTEDKRGRKIWIWGLSREGMIWEDLLTDPPGKQYVEIQTGRLFNQTSEKSSQTPFKHHEFASCSTDLWTEYWMPVQGIQGFNGVSEIGAINILQCDKELTVKICPVVYYQGTIQFAMEGNRTWTQDLNLQPMQPVEIVCPLENLMDLDTPVSMSSNSNHSDSNSITSSVADLNNANSNDTNLNNANSNETNSNNTNLNGANIWKNDRKTALEYLKPTLSVRLGTPTFFEWKSNDDQTAQISRPFEFSSQLLGQKVLPDFALNDVLDSLSNSNVDSNLNTDSNSNVDSNSVADSSPSDGTEKQSTEEKKRELEEKSPTFHYQMGQEWLRQREYAKSDAEFELCLKLDPLYIDAYTGLAENANRRGNYQKAFEICQLALSIDTYSPGVNRQFGLAAFALDNLTDAEEAFSVAALSDSSRAASLTALAKVRLKKQEWNAALQTAEKALQYNTQNDDAYWVKLVCLRKLKSADNVEIEQQTNEYSNINDKNTDKSFDESTRYYNYSAKGAGKKTNEYSNSNNINTDEYYIVSEQLLSENPLRHFVRADALFYLLQSDFPTNQNNSDAQEINSQSSQNNSSLAQNAQKTGQKNQILLQARKQEFLDSVRCELPHETFLELAVRYRNVGLNWEASELLRLALQKTGIKKTEILYTVAFLDSDPEMTSLREKNKKENKASLTEYYPITLKTAEQESPDFCFPFRPEALSIFEWAAKNGSSWKNKYYLAIIDQFLERKKEAKQLLDSLNKVPDYPPFYVLRANLELGTDETALKKRLDDFQTAFQLSSKQADGESLYAAFFCTELLKQNKNEQLLSLTSTYTKRFPLNTKLVLLHAQALLAFEEYENAQIYLKTATFLPNEGSSAGRELYRKVSLLAAAKKYQEKDFENSLRLTSEARDWPENLGAGKPYSDRCDERLEDALTVCCLLRLNRSDEAADIQKKINKDDSVGKIFNERNFDVQESEIIEIIQSCL